MAIDLETLMVDALHTSASQHGYRLKPEHDLMLLRILPDTAKVSAPALGLSVIAATQLRDIDPNTVEFPEFSKEFLGFLLGTRCSETNS